MVQANDPSQRSKPTVQANGPSQRFKPTAQDNDLSQLPKSSNGSRPAIGTRWPQENRILHNFIAA
jgi:hypothetical protein